MKFSSRRSALLLSSALVGLAMLGLGGVAYAADQTYQFDIPAESLGQALTDFSRASSQQIVFSEDLTAGKSTKALHGRYTASEALNELLAGTGLHVETNSSGVMMVRSKNAQAASSGGAANPTDIETVVVTGTNIRGVENPTAPVIVLDNNYIKSTGYATVTSLFESLPQNFSLDNQSGARVPGSGNGATQGSSIDLRGMGEGTTLILLNGRRLPLGFNGSAADISAIPLSAVDRVEVLPDGASAIYGSDAVGGVVNIILKTDFDGAETQGRIGAADGGFLQYSASQTFGRQWETGSALVSVSYRKQDLLPAGDRDFTPPSAAIGSLLPRDEDFGLTFTGHQRVFQNVTAFADVLYTHRNSFNRATPNNTLDTSATNTLHNPQLSATLGVDVDLSSEWQLEIAGSYASNRSTLLATSSQYASPTYGGPETLREFFQTASINVKADGPLWTWAGGTAKAAIGVEQRNESLDYHFFWPARSGVAGDLSQVVRSAFAEVFVPIVGPDNAIPGLRKFELSVAGRYDDYNRFGSSFNPKVGLLWAPTNELNLRANWGTSYRAPQLYQYNPANNGGLAFYSTDPTDPTGKSHLFLATGINNNLSPQTSDNLSAGAEWKPVFMPGVSLSTNYFHINYKNQIASPNPSYLAMLNNLAAYGSLITKDPSAAVIMNLVTLAKNGAGFFAYTPTFAPDTSFDPSSIATLVDLRVTNLSRTVTSGIDFSGRYDFTVAGDSAHLGLDSTYLIEGKSQITATSPLFATVGTIYNLPHWRLRVSSGWSHAEWGANIFVNYTGSYKDTRSAPSVPVDSYTTVDAQIRYAFDDDSILADSTIRLSAQNLFNQDPPRVAVLNPITDMGFDPTNASPLGRLVSLEITKTW